MKGNFALALTTGLLIIALAFQAGIAGAAPGTPGVSKGVPSPGKTGVAADPRPKGPGNPAQRPLSSVGMGFTYQGRLSQSGSPANGQFDLQFTLNDAATAGNQVGSPVTVISQTVFDGLFTVQLDFGSSAFQGDARYLEIAVRQAGGGSFTTLSPRQPLTPSPYALSLVPGAVISGTRGSALLTANNANANGLYGISNYGTG